MRDKIFLIGWMIITVALAGELKFYPFHDAYRISLGTAVFFFFLLWEDEISPILSGIIVGGFIVLFRIILDWFTHQSIPFISDFMIHSPAFFYYFVFAVLFTLSQIRRFRHLPLVIGILGVAIDILTSFTELFIRYSLSHKVITLSIIYQIIIFATIRSFFVIGFFHIIQLRQAKLKEEEQQKQNEHMLMLISSLYEETIHLKKSLQNAEDITRDCYDLYQLLKKQTSTESHHEYAKKALIIAGQVHEIKKDNQRIFAGLSKMISNESPNNYMSIESLGKLIIQTNEKVARLLGKDIQFLLQIKGSHPFYHIYTTLSLINNLVINAVESIQKEGTIRVLIYKQRESVIFRVSDNGPGIPEKQQQLIFKPGFTTKYDHLGKPSTGIGLSYVKEVVESLHGEVTCHSHDQETVFTIRLPIHSLEKKE
ncbi:sensor histidine kinase [Thermoflavimicrobium daqui]|uniref:histidine kinase n=1 Tax=Thermoflavimicrobium daqui TaxID=2137476 RepID=A0A364K3Z2_9BACL|nr:sensor histidine kinase [Thermoflavimicrobium daqui]RAL24011.1 ATP-binding protein [Thermoflavimicrobium daqui]